MIDLNEAVNLLLAKRTELLEQLAAIDQALAALTGAGVAVVPLPAPSAAPASDQATSEVLPTKVRPPRILSDEHKHALKEGRRKARHSKDVAAGLAREAIDSPAAVSPSPAEGQQPRLVKRDPTAS